jgi:hypothetical protein
VSFFENLRLLRDYVSVRPCPKIPKHSGQNRHFPEEIGKALYKNHKKTDIFAKKAEISVIFLYQKLLQKVYFL